jgi:Rrf2 family iron-sulfur cluster assembly transcriptional regulator
VKLRARGYAAVTVMVEIAQKGGKTPVSLAVVAATIGISVPYVEQLTADLRRSGLIRTFRGSRGGYRLAKPACEISVLDVVLSAEDCAGARGNEADGGLVSSKNPQAQDLWDRLEKFQCLFLQHLSLADVINGDLSNHSLLKRMLNMLE